MTEVQGLPPTVVYVWKNQALALGPSLAPCDGRGLGEPVPAHQSKSTLRSGGHDREYTWGMTALSVLCPISRHNPRACWGRQLSRAAHLARCLVEKTLHPVGIALMLAAAQLQSELQAAGTPTASLCPLCTAAVQQEHRRRTRLHATAIRAKAPADQGQPDVLCPADRPADTHNQTLQPSKATEAEFIELEASLAARERASRREALLTASGLLLPWSCSSQGSALAGALSVLLLPKGVHWACLR